MTERQLFGDIAVGILFISGQTPELDINALERQSAINEIKEGMSQLAKLNRRANLRFVYDYQVVTVEVTDPNATINTWALAAFRQLGVTGDGRTAPLTYVDRLQKTLDTDQAFVAYISKFNLSKSGAGLGNVATWLRWSDLSSSRFIIEHEVCHLFGAPDEYEGGSACTNADDCDRTFGPYNVKNSNCSLCTTKQEPCIMRRSREWTMCKYTPAHLGWNNPATSPDVPLAIRNGQIWFIQPGGGLHWYRHLDPVTGSDSWANNARAKEIGGFGWGEYESIHAADDGVLYAIDRETGQLHWYRHTDFINGSDNWETPNYRRIGGNQWAKLKHLAVANDGVIYVTSKDAGRLHWYRHLGFQTGSNAWANDWKAQEIGGTGWSDYQYVSAAENGVIYALTKDGRMHWYRHTGFANGENTWANDGNAKVIGGTGWGNYIRVHAAGNGALYCVRKDGRMHWYRHTGFANGENTWANDGNAKVIGGTGWR